MDQANQTATPSASDLLRAFRKCTHLQGKPSGSHGQGRILALLLRDGPQTQSALSKLVERKPATLCQQLDAMESAGLVKRRRSETDKRTVVVTLTLAGEAAAREAITRRENLAQRLFGDMGEDDRRELLRLLENRYEHWRDQMEEEAE